MVSLMQLYAIPCHVGKLNLTILLSITSSLLHGITFLYAHCEHEVRLRSYNLRLFYRMNFFLMDTMLYFEHFIEIRCDIGPRLAKRSHHVESDKIVKKIQRTHLKLQVCLVYSIF